MDSEESVYSGKALAYVDHNILDLCVKYGHEQFGEALFSDYQVVYSDETLLEIRRSKGYESKFVEVLRGLDARYLEILHDSDMKDTGKATVRECDPAEVYQEYITDTTTFDHVHQALVRLSHKLHGGLPEKKLAEVWQEQNEAFSMLIEELLEMISGAADEFVEEGEDPELLSGMLTELTDALKANQGENDGLLGELPAKLDSGSGAIDGYKQVSKLSAEQLNNIKGANVVEQVYQAYQNSPLFEDWNPTIEEFFGLNISVGSEHRHQKVGVLYSMLNIVGYYPDEKLKKSRKFVSSLSDRSHASYATYCTILFTADRRMAKKIEAAYEYLKIPTFVQFVTVKTKKEEPAPA